MSLTNLNTELLNVLQADAGLIAWAQDNFKKEFTVLKSNREVSSIMPADMPAFIIDMGDGRSEITVSNHQQDNAAQPFVTVAWYENDNDATFDQRTALVDLMIKAVMANPTLNNKVDGAWISGWASDKNIYHPKHLMRFEITGEYPVYNI